MVYERINLLSVPVDILSRSDIEEKILELLKAPEPAQICFITVWDVLKARTNKEFMSCLKNAALVLPVSKSIITGASFLKLSPPVRYNPFNAVISVLGIMDKYYKSLYLFGGKKDYLSSSERNIRATFPNLQVVGRYVGYYPKTAEKDILSAVKKAAPALLLISDGVPSRLVWAYRNRNQLFARIILNYPDAFPVFSKRKRKISAETFEKGLEIWTEVVKNPLKIFLIFPFLWYMILLLWYKCFRD